MPRILPVVDAMYAAGKILNILPPKGKNRSTRVLVECAHCPEHRPFECPFPALRSGTQKSCGCLKKAFRTNYERVVARLSPNERLTLFNFKERLHDSARVVTRREIRAIKRVRINRYVVDFAWRAELTRLKALPNHRLKSISHTWEDEGPQQTTLFYGLSREQAYRIHRIWSDCVNQTDKVLRPAATSPEALSIA